MRLTGTYGPVVDHRELRRLLLALAQRVVVEGRGGREAPAVFVWGPPGVGKSDVVRSVAAEAAARSGRRLVEYEGYRTFELVSRSPRDYLVLVDLRASQLEPSDVQGLPRFVESDGLRYTLWAPPLWAAVLGLDGIAGVLFLDEVNLASPLVQAALYQVVLEKRVGSLRLSPRVLVVAAGNREGVDNPYATPLPAPLANRFIHVVLECPDVASWLSWARENNVHPWVVEFIAALGAGGKSLLCTSAGEAKAFPTPRSWEMAGHLIRACQRSGGCKTPDSEDTVMAVASAVGVEAANEWLLWAELLRGLPPVSRLAREPGLLIEKIEELLRKGNTMAPYYLITRAVYSVLDDPEAYAALITRLWREFLRRRLTVDYIAGVLANTQHLVRGKLGELRSKNPRLYRELEMIIGQLRVQAEVVH